MVLRHADSTKQCNENLAWFIVTPISRKLSHNYQMKKLEAKKECLLNIYILKRCIPFPRQVFGFWICWCRDVITMTLRCTINMEKNIVVL